MAVPPEWYVPVRMAKHCILMPPGTGLHPEASPSACPPIRGGVCRGALPFLEKGRTVASSEGLGRLLARLWVVPPFRLIPLSQMAER
jgi:hypothetical protein